MTKIFMNQLTSSEGEIIKMLVVDAIRIARDPRLRVSKSNIQYELYNSWKLFYLGKMPSSGMNLHNISDVEIELHKGADTFEDPFPNATIVRKLLSFILTRYCEKQNELDPDDPESLEKWSKGWETEVIPILEQLTASTTNDTIGE